MATKTKEAPPRPEVVAMPLRQALTEADDWPVVPGKFTLCSGEPDCKTLVLDLLRYQWVACSHPSHRLPRESDNKFAARMEAEQVPVSIEVYHLDLQVEQEFSMHRSGLGPKGKAVALTNALRAAKIVRELNLREDETDCPLRVRPSNIDLILAKADLEALVAPPEDEPRPSYTDPSERKSSRSATPQDCWCGCEGLTKGGRFLPGHDAKLKGRLTGTVKDATLLVKERKEALARVQELGWEKFVPLSILQELGV